MIADLPNFKVVTEMDISMSIGVPDSTGKRYRRCTEDVRKSGGGWIFYGSKNQIFAFLLT